LTFERDQTRKNFSHCAFLALGCPAYLNPSRFQRWNLFYYFLGLAAPVGVAQPRLLSFTPLALEMSKIEAPSQGASPRVVRSQG
jgi:hypothetical protein